MIKKLIAMPILAILFMTTADAAVYECQVKDSMDVKASGHLGKYQLGAIGSKFTVDSQKGTILGSHISNQEEFADKPQIFSSGYVRIFTFVGGPYISYPLLLEIRQGGFYRNS